MLRRKVIFTLVTVAAMAIGAPVASASANGEHASCQGTLSSTDGQRQFRDDVAREIASADFPPGVFYRFVSREAAGTTYAQCEASLGL